MQAGVRGARLPRARKQSGYADGGSRGREWNDLMIVAEFPHGAVAPAGRRLSVDPRIAPNFHSPAVDVEDPVVGPPALGVEAGLLFTIESETRDGDLDDQGGARRMRVEEVPRATLNHRHIGLRLRVGAEGNRHLDPHLPAGAEGPPERLGDQENGSGMPRGLRLFADELATDQLHTLVLVEQPESDKAVILRPSPSPGAHLPDLHHSTSTRGYRARPRASMPSVGYPPPAQSPIATVTDRVAPKVGMIAECLPGPPATITIRSSGLAQSATSSARRRPRKRPGPSTPKRSRFSGLKRSSLTRARSQITRLTSALDQPESAKVRACSGPRTMSGSPPR